MKRGIRIDEYWQFKSEEKQKKKKLNYLKIEQHCLEFLFYREKKQAKT